MDPTGIGAAIIKTIFWGYLVAAGIALALALWLPKSKVAKAIAAAVVLGLAAIVPVNLTRHSEQAKRDRQSVADAIERVCVSSKLETQPMERVPGFYASRASLEAGPVGFQKMDFAFVVRYMVERKLSYLEVDPPDQDFLNGVQYKFAIDGVEHPFVRLQLTPRGHSACQWYESWVSTYPAQKLPELRRNGLSPAQCIGAVCVPSLQSRYRLRVEQTPVSLGVQGGTLTERHLTIDDALTQRRTADFRSIVNDDRWGNRHVLCGKKVDTERFDKLIPIEPETQLLAPQVVQNDDPSEFLEVRAATEKDIVAARGIRGVNKMTATNVISEDGATWVDSKYIKTDSTGSFRLDGYYLAMLRQGRLIRTLLRHQGTKLLDNTGLQVVTGAVRIVASNGSRTVHYLLEYGDDGTPMSALLLTAEQLRALEGP